MTSLSRRHFVVLGAAALLSGCSTAMVPSGTATPPNQLSQAAIVAAINGTRARNGRPPLKYNSQLEAAVKELVAALDRRSTQN